METTALGSDKKGVTPGSSGRGRGGVPRGLALLLVAVVVAGGAWVVYGAVSGRGLALGGSALAIDETPQQYQLRLRQQWIEARQRNAQRGRLDALLNDPEIVRARPAGRGEGWEVAGGQTVLVVVKAGSGYRVAADSFDPAVLSPADQKLLQQVARLHSSGGATMTGGQKVTPEQLEKLAGINALARYTIASDDEAKFVQLFEAWRNADTGGKPAAATALRDAVIAFESAQAGGLRSEMQKRVETVRSVLSAEQIQAMR